MYWDYDCLTAIQIKMLSTGVELENDNTTFVSISEDVRVQSKSYGYQIEKVWFCSLILKKVSADF